MYRKCIAALGLAAVLCVSSAAQDAKTVIANAAKAMGADNLKTIQYSGSGTESSFGQAYDTKSGWPGLKSRRTPERSISRRLRGRSRGLTETSPLTAAEAEAP